MLPFDFDYFKPRNLNEAVLFFQEQERLGKHPMFICGGTELLTLGRIDLVYTEAVIDLKGIAEAKALGLQGDFLVLGSALSLTELEEANPFPLLTKTSSEIADHTARGKITLGGNICAMIFYREAVLPFLLSDSQVVIAGPKGISVTPINDLFQEQLNLKEGEFLVQIATEKRFITAPYYTYKRRQQWDTGYPLITIAALKIENEIRVAISGLCPFPFRSKQLEQAMNLRDITHGARVDKALQFLPEPILHDVEGTKEYRLFVLNELLKDVLAALDDK